MSVGDTESPESRSPDAAKGGRPKRVVRWLGASLAIALAILIGLGVVVRFGVQTDTGRNLIAAPLEGLSLGQLGRLHVEGLTGDILSDFGLRRLTLVDDQGVWLDVRDIRVRWRSLELIRRRVHVLSATASEVDMLRRPVAKAGGGGSSSGLPVSIAIDRLQVRLETLPAVSVQRGLFNIGASFDIERRGGLGGSIQAWSLLHAGDGLNARFDLGLHKRLMLRAQALEACGGALAGFLGLPANRALQIDADADGALGDGRLDMEALSNDHPFAEARGAWRNGGGSINGWVSLTASSLTSGMAKAFGPVLRLSIESQPGANGLQKLHGRLADDNGDLVLTGVLDPKKVAAPNSYELDLGIFDLKRLVAAPAMGAATAIGRLSTTADGWSWAGKAAVKSLSTDGYSLGSLNGPVEVVSSKGEIRFKVDAQGMAGQGQGMLAEAAGARPHLSLDASRLADGRLMLRSIKAVGAGVELTASGERSLLGALNFEGVAKLGDLAVFRAGAHGGLQADWSAVQSKAGRPWTFSLDAQGRQLASGETDLDKLLGSAPRLTVQAQDDQGAVSISQAEFAGANARAALAGGVGRDGALKMAVNWSAEGPLDVGPVGLLGKAAGSGAIGGTLSAPTAVLAADFDRVDLPGLTLRPAHVDLTYSGAADAVSQVAVTGGGDYGSAHAKANFRFINDGLSIDGLDVAAGGLALDGSLALRGAEPTAANLVFSVAPGAFLSRGVASGKLMLGGDAGAAIANVTLTAKDVTPRGATIVISNAALTAQGPLAKLPYSLTADGVSSGAPFRLRGSGQVIEQDGGRTVSFAGAGRIRDADFHTLSPVIFSLAGADASVQAQLSYGGGTADLTLKQAAGAVSGKAELNGVDLTALGEDVVGRVTGDLSLDGEGPRLDGVLNAHLQGLRSRDAANTLALSGDVEARLSDDQLNIKAALSGAQPSDVANVELALPAEASAIPFNIALPRDRPIDGRFDANAELQPIWDLFFGGDRTLGGRLVAQGRIGGTLASPRPVGHATLTDGRFEDAATGLKLRKLDADVDLHDDVLSVSKFSGADAKAGTLTGQGRFSLAANGPSNLTLTANGFQLLDNDAAKATASGALSVTRGADGRATLAGQLTIDRADISAVSARSAPGVTNLDVTEINGQANTANAPAAADHAGPAVALDVRLRAPRGVFVKGLGLNAEMSLDAQVGGTTAAPVLSGTARVVRGDYDLAGKRFEIDDQGVVYLATQLDKIRLDLVAKLDDPSITAQINIAGTAAKPEITLSSTPALPSDEVLSEVLFGSSAAQLSPVQAAQLAAAVTSLATGGGFDVMGGLKNFARLDRLSLGGGDPTTGLTVSGGKYISNNVYLEVTGGGRQGPSAQVEVRANRSLSVISEVGGDVGAKLSVRWRLDYGKVKAPKNNAQNRTQP